MLSDLKFALRTLAKSPAFTAVAVLVLALGIGANTAVFSLVDAFVFRPMPLEQPGRIYQIYSQDRKSPDRFRAFSYPTYTDLRSSLHSYTSIMAHNLCILGVGEGDTTRRAFAGIVSANYFSTLGVKLVQGRAFSPEEEAPGSAVPVVIVSYNYWLKHGRDPLLVGQTVRLDNQLYTIVGITPRGFTGTMTLFSPEFWLPLGVYDQVQNDFSSESHRKLAQRDAYSLMLVGRLAPGVTAAAAGAELAAQAAHLEKAFPVENKDQTMITQPLPRMSTSTGTSDESDLQATGVLLLGMAAIVLLIACLNLANMLLARGTARRKEFAIRLAIGGSRWRIVRQLLLEGFLLALLGGVAGLLVAAWSSDLLVASLGRFMPFDIVFDTGPDFTVFAAALGFCALGTLFFALGPALKSSRADIVNDLKEQSGEDRAPMHRKWLPRSPLVVLQVALSLALLTAAGLFIRGAFKAAGAEPGFTIANQAVLETDASLAGYPAARARDLYRTVGERLAALPGVEAVSVGSVIPFGMISLSRNVQRAGVEVPPDAKPSTAAEGLAYSAHWNSIGTDFFKALGLPLLAGRTFTRAETDAPGAPRVAIIDDVLARKLWPEGGALGQRLQFAERSAPRAQKDDDAGVGMQVSVPAMKKTDNIYEIVGIAAGSRNNLFEKKADGHVYVPFAQGYQGNVFFHVRAPLPNPDAETALLAAIRREVRAIDPQLPILGIKSMRQHMDASVELWIIRAGAVLFSVFGGLALFLAVIGVYGVKAYSVARRTREIGIRMALGARPGEVLWMILREGLVITLTGTALGLLLAAGVARLVSGLLYQVGALDPLVFSLAPLLLAAAALLACWVPARRATKVDPITALRTE